MIIMLTKQNAQQELAKITNPLVIDVFATWCGPCMEMKPIFETVAQKLGDQYAFAQLNVDEARELAIQFGVTSVPTFIFMKNNAVVGKEIGFMNEEDLTATIKEHLG